MKKLTFLTILFYLCTSSIFGQQATADIPRPKAMHAVHQIMRQSVKDAAGFIKSTNAFETNALFKIGLPPEIALSLVQLGVAGKGAELKDVETKMNILADQLTEQIQSAFMGEIPNTTINDPMALLTGRDTAITANFEVNSRDNIISDLYPTVQSAFKQNNILNEWQDIMTAYNSQPLVSNSSIDIAKYAATIIVNRTFDVVALQEQKIRTNPASANAQVVTDVLTEIQHP